jgi:hypothetical protein
MASRAVARLAHRLLALRPAMPSTLPPTQDLRGPAAMALAQAWRHATGAVGAGVISQPSRLASASAGDAGADANASTSGFAPAPPGRVAEMAALFTCNVCGACRGMGGWCGRLFFSFFFSSFRRAVPDLS